MNSLSFTNKRILILAPHTDDGELGCGGTISKLTQAGNEVYYAAFSACQQSVIKEFPSDILITEVKEATAVLGIKPENLFLYDFEVRTFNYRRQEILDKMIRLKADLKPQIVFMPSINDIHQDHFTITNEAMRAFKFSTVLNYELPWNNFSFNSTCFIELEEEHVKRKVEAMACYKSQAHRNYCNADFITSLARVRGTQIEKKYAETFEVTRLIL
ncbi:MAG: PIG-L deacetylase family protein [Sediminibacterium sp.]|nr:PIG-L deacetylase family protein [Sediminibacterium sp.]